MRYLNVGCGLRYFKDAEWTNVDIVSTGEDVIACDLKNGIPFPNNTFDFVYHSHVFEHIPKSQADFFISECIRVLRPNGILRVVIPDLEGIITNYLRLLEKGIENPNSKEIAADYDWIMLEMYDQCVRNTEGGEMLNYLKQEPLINQDFVFSRISTEGKNMRKSFLNSKSKKPYKFIPDPLWKRVISPKTYSRAIEQLLTFSKRKFIRKNKEVIETGKFRLCGETHQWMYDRYSLSRILFKHGLVNISTRKADESYLQNWSKYNLDTEPDGSTYKPDSLFMEGLKK